MADVTVKILVPAENFDLISLDEAKIAMGSAAAEAGNDAQLQWLISTNSAVISTLCNRVFAKETLTETWRDLDARRLYLTHWPVKEEDIESVTTNGVDRLDWELDEGQGKLSIFSDRNEPIVVTYTGGYALPDESPMALRQATALMVTTTKSEQSAASLTGVRMISHKESRVMFHSPTSGGSSTSGPSNAQTRATVQSLLGHFIKLWI